MLNSQFEKDVIFDIYCTNQGGDHFIIEMQRSKQHFENGMVKWLYFDDVVRKTGVDREKLTMDN